MKLPRIAVWVYLLGMIPMGIYYDQVKAETGSGWRFVLVAVAYLLALRLLSEIVERTAARIHKSRESPPGDA